MRESGSARKRRKTEPTRTDLEIGSREMMATRKPVQLNLSTAPPQQLGEGLGLLGFDQRVGPARNDLHGKAVEIGKYVRNERDHRPE